MISGTQRTDTEKPVACCSNSSKSSLSSSAMYRFASAEESAKRFNADPRGSSLIMKAPCLSVSGPAFAMTVRPGRQAVRDARQPCRDAKSQLLHRFPQDRDKSMHSFGSRSKKQFSFNEVYISVRQCTIQTSRSA